MLVETNFIHGVSAAHEPLEEEPEDFEEIGLPEDGELLDAVVRDHALHALLHEVVDVVAEQVDAARTDYLPVAQLVDYELQEHHQQHVQLLEFGPLHQTANLLQELADGVSDWAGNSWITLSDQVDVHFDYCLDFVQLPSAPALVA